MIEHCQGAFCITCGEKNRCYRCCHTCNGLIENKEEISILVHNLNHTRRIKPTIWYGMNYYWQVLSYARQHSNNFGFMTVWREKETGNDELLGKFKNQREII